MIIMPVALQLELTQQCNLRCVYCYNDSNMKTKEHLRKDLLRNIILQAKSMGFFHLVFSGGEPLLYQYYEPAFQYAFESDFNVVLNTNATILNSRIVSLLQHNKVKQVNINLESHNKLRHDQIRGQECFDLVVANIRKMADLGLRKKICIGFVLNNLNQADLEGYFAFIKNLELDSIRFIHFLPIGRGGRHHNLEVDFATLPDIIRQLSKLSIEYNIRVLYGHSLDILVKRNDIPASQLATEIASCEAGKIGLTIDCHGNVYPCPFLKGPYFYCGNVNERPLIDIWNKSDILQLLRNNALEDSECLQCKGYKICYGGCNAWKFYKNGRIDIRDPRCSAIHG
ncbi:MAG: radical SAM protein [Firmicutes bacterium]|nr:radical SAM protein [Bacillota bacterium]